MSELSAYVTGKALDLPPALAEGHKAPGKYQPAAGLEAAIEVALLLGEPILLTGDPGVGKTQAALWLASSLKATPLLVTNVKSTSTGVELLYNFDEVARFRDSSRGREKPLVSYLRFNGLGEAILRAAGGRAVLQTFAGEPLEGALLDIHADQLAEAFGEGWKSIDGAARAADLLPNDPGFATAPPTHRVLLIDELDKAPRDTPNDLLNEIANMSFRIPELGLQVVSDKGRRPVVVITSNSEKALPDPFLRRCVFFDIPFPDKAQLERILEGSIDALEGGGSIVGEAIDLFQLFRDRTNAIRRAPGTAELLGWLDVLVTRHGFGPSDTLRLAANREKLSASLVAVLKSRDDQEEGRRILDSWLPRGQAATSERAASG